MAIGGNHFIHMIRRNIDVNVILLNNQIYGLTKGQASPTTDPGMVTKHQPHGVIMEPFNPLAVALSLGSGFVARGFSGNKKQLVGLIAEGIQYRGFALINILQPCISFNRINTYGWYNKRIYDLKAENHIVDDFQNAMNLAFQWGDRIPTGIIYKKEKASYTDRINVLKDGPMIEQKYNPEKITSVLAGL